MTDLDQVVAFAPVVLVVGTGAYGVMKVPTETSEQLQAAGIRVEVLPTADACRRFGELDQQGEKVAGAFHLTC